MRTLRARLLGVAMVWAAVGMSGSALAETLVGDTVELWRYPQSTGVASLDSSALVVSPGHEFTGVIINPIWTLNVEATSIRLDAVSSFFSPYFNTGYDPTYFELRDLDFVGEPDRYIAGVNVSFSRTISVHQDSPLGWPDYNASNVSFTGDSVRIHTGGYEFNAGDFIQVDLITAPEPGSLALLGLGSLVLVRRRGCSHRKAADE